jgi:hypothetical protein
LDDQFFLRPRCRSVGVEGRALHLAGICYCSINTTDGLIVSAAIPLVAAQAEVEPSVADLLVSVGLWERLSDAYLVVDFLDYNPSREKVLAERSAARDRAARARSSSDVRAKSGRSSQASSRPPTDAFKSSSSLGLVGAREDDNPAVSGTVWAEIARRKLAAQRPGEVRNAAKWLETTEHNARIELGAKARDYLERYDLSDGQLVDVLLSPVAPQWLNTCRRPA